MSISYWENQPTDQPWLVNGFNGTWNFRDHSLIPNTLANFIMASFPKHEKMKRIPLEEINALMNEVWEGPGSMVKIEKLTHELRLARLGSNDISLKSGSLGDVKTIEDYDKEEEVSFSDNDEEDEE